MSLTKTLGPNGWEMAGVELPVARLVKNADGQVVGVYDPTTGATLPLSLVSTTTLRLGTDQLAVANTTVIGFDTVVLDDLAVFQVAHPGRIYIPDRIKKIRVNALVQYKYDATYGGTYRGISANIYNGAGAPTTYGIKGVREPATFGTATVVTQIATGLIDIQNWLHGSDANYMEIKAAHDAAVAPDILASGNSYFTVEMYQ